MQESVVVRPTHASDHSAILRVVRSAFASEGHEEQDEVDIVETIWSLRAQVDALDLVAVRKGEVVGHVLGSWGVLGGTAMVGIAPLAVRPPDQRSGVGRALMQEVVRQGNLSGHPLLFLLGDPLYYERFGFEPAVSLGAWYAQGGPGDPHFMVRRLEAFSRCPKGEYRYAWELRS